MNENLAYWQLDFTVESFLPPTDNFLRIALLEDYLLDAYPNSHLNSKIYKRIRFCNHEVYYRNEIISVEHNYLLEDYLLDAWMHACVCVCVSVQSQPFYNI